MMFKCNQETTDYFMSCCVTVYSQNSATLLWSNNIYIGPGCVNSYNDSYNHDNRETVYSVENKNTNFSSQYQSLTKFNDKIGNSL